MNTAHSIERAIERGLPLSSHRGFQTLHLTSPRTCGTVPLRFI